MPWLISAKKPVTDRMERSLSLDTDFFKACYDLHFAFCANPYVFQAGTEASGIKGGV